MLRLLSLLALTIAVLAQPASAAWSQETPAPGRDDWPQLAHDPQRTNASASSIPGPYRFYWRWVGPPIAARVQPVVADGRLFVGGLDGVMYALDASADAQGGAPPILWQQFLASPIRAGAGVDGEVVVVGTHAGTVVGLDASTGQLLWSTATGGAVLASPLIAGGIAFLGSADGTVVAIRTADGSITWKQRLDAPIGGSAALSSDGRLVFVVAENVTAYALDSATGSIVWQSPLQGQSAADRWPVVTGNAVVFRTMPLPHFHELLRRGDEVMDGAGVRSADPAADWKLVWPAISQHLARNPADQTFFALDSSSGRSLGVAAVLYTFGSNDAPAPPTAVDQKLFLPYRARHGIQNDSSSDIHVTTHYDAELGQLDPVSLEVAGLTSSDSFAYQFRLTSDEAAVTSAAGQLLLVDNWERLGGIDLSGRGLVGIAQVWPNAGCATVLGPNDALMPFFDGCAVPGQVVGEGDTRVGAVVAAGRIFWKPLANGLAAIGPADGSSGAPLLPSSPAPALAPPPRPTAQTPALADYVWNQTRPMSGPPADLVERLQQQVQLIVASPEHLLPFYLQRGFHGLGSWPPDVQQGKTEPAQVADSNGFWFDPGELILSLSSAYPYLTPDLQTQTRAYLQAEMSRFSPLQPLPFPAAPWLTQGRPREPYAVPDRGALGTWPPPGVPLQTIYALWAYGNATGDWSYVSDHWSAIRTLFNARRDTIDSYAEIAGAIGYARIARQLGDAAEAIAGETVAVSAMQAGLDFGRWLDRANALYPPDPSVHDEMPGRLAPVFFGLTPEVGRYLRDTNLAAVDYTLQDVAGYPFGSYLWYATRAGVQAERGETSYQSPAIGWSVFLAQAYVRQASAQDLRRWLDRPWAIGDLWHLQKLVATIQAGGR